MLTKEQRDKLRAKFERIGGGRQVLDDLNAKDAEIAALKNELAAKKEIIDANKSFHSIQLARANERIAELEKEREKYHLLDMEINSANRIANDEQERAYFAAKESEKKT